MELTYHLPIGSWYWYDTEYWGLDYPPLTAYVSYICGALSHVLVGPESVALVSSRAHENPVHKSFMRATVLVCDLVFYGTAVWTLLSAASSTKGNKTMITAIHWGFLVSMTQPAILLIDHGHFQYNTVALGLSLWAFHNMTLGEIGVKSRMTNPMVGSIFFCLALSFKQMTLYYAPAVFFYLLGRCMFVDGTTAGSRIVKAAWRVTVLGSTVVACFVLLWWPFVAYGPDNTTYADRALHVLRRIIPLQRGLFEGKVSNLWCALSVRPISIRRRIPEHLQPIAALLLTLLLLIPSSYKMFQSGLGGVVTSRHRELLLWGATNSALAFFLASFQVHEKSLLLALAPCSMLWTLDTTFVRWFCIVTTWTLWPLIQIDQLQTAYVCLILIFLSVAELRRELSDDGISQARGFFEQNFLFRRIPLMTYLCMIGLHVTEMSVTAPAHLPDLFAVLWSVVGCAFCCLAWLITCWHLFRASHSSQRPSKQKVS
jgi:alpha-1,3-glucosyltransferase